MAKTESEVINKVEKQHAQSGAAADNIDRIELMRAGTTGGGRDNGAGQPESGSGKFLEMTDPFAKQGGEGHAEKGGGGGRSGSSEGCKPGGGGGNVKEMMKELQKQQH